MSKVVFDIGCLAEDTLNLSDEIFTVSKGSSSEELKEIGSA